MSATITERINLKGRVEEMSSNEELFLLGDVDTLYERNKKLMYHIANKFSNLKLEQDDFIGCGDIAFTKAIKKFNPSKSKWATFFSRIMVNEILMINRNLNRQVETIALETIISGDRDFNVLVLQDVIKAPVDVTEKVVNRIAIEECIKLSKKQDYKKLEIFKLYLNGVKQREIAERLNLSQSYISRVIKKVCLEIRENYENIA